MAKKHPQPSSPRRNAPTPTIKGNTNTPRPPKQPFSKAPILPRRPIRQPGR